MRHDFLTNFLHGFVIGFGALTAINLLRTIYDSGYADGKMDGLGLWIRNKDNVIKPDAFKDKIEKGTENQHE